MSAWHSSLEFWRGRVRRIALQDVDRRPKTGFFVPIADSPVQAFALAASTITEASASMAPLRRTGSWAIAPPRPNRIVDARCQYPLPYEGTAEDHEPGRLTGAESAVGLICFAEASRLAASTIATIRLERCARRKGSRHLVPLALPICADDFGAASYISSPP
jgi:hypothetical protein